MSRARMTQWGYEMRVYGGMRAANRQYSPTHDMAAQPFPQLIQLQTINACQASCTMCPYPLFKNTFPRGRMDDGLLDKLLVEIAAQPLVRTFIPMLQNEPLLDKRLFARLRQIKELTNGRVGTELVTNGALLTDEVIAQIRESRLDILDISLDALSRETYRTIRKGLDYDTVLAGVERAVRADLPDTNIFVRLVKLRDNEGEVKAFARHWRKRGVPVFVYTANNRTGALTDFDETHRLTTVPLLHKVGRRVARAYFGHCPFPFGSASILHNGDVLICAHDWARSEVIGNVRDATLAEVWNGPRMREIRALIHARQYEQIGSCRNCSLWKDGWF